MNATRSAMYLSLLWCFVSLLTLSQNRDTSLQIHSHHTVTVGYFNDDFLVENEINDFVGNKLFPALDDHVTTGFYLLTSFSLNDVHYFADASFSILTDRQRQFRTDIIILRSGIEGTSSSFRYRLGAGFALNGMYGGSAIQNGYHTLFQYKKLDLNYLSDETMGFQIVLFSQTILFKHNTFVISPFASAEIFSDAAPSSLRAGVINSAEFLSVQWEFLLKHTYRFSYHSRMNNIFSTTLTTGISGSIPLSGTFRLGLWMTQNQFINTGELHFGLDIHWSVDETSKHSYLSQSF